MLHVDEGQLHAYLDGELAAVGGDPAELERHLATCPACRGRMEEARRTHDRAASLLGEASPPETIIPPFDGVVGRAALASRGGATLSTGIQSMTTTTAEFGKPRFKRLIASGGQKRRAWNSRTALASLVLHSALIIGAVYATVRAEQAEEEEELVEFMEIEEKAPEPEEEEPEPEQPKEEPPPPPATQALTPPEEPPAAIPEVDLSAPAVSAEDFTGIGQVAEEAAPAPAAPPPPPEPEFAYELAELDTKPSLANQSTIQSVMERLYPRILQDAGIGGTVNLQFVIEPDGSVDMSSVKVIDSPHEQLSEASVKAVERFRFRPGKYKGESVRVLIQMPITWQPSS